MDSEIGNRDIERKLKKIFIERFKMDMDNCDQSILNSNLLGYKIGMAPRDLIYLFFDIEKEFNIVIAQEDIIEGRFNSFNNILEIVKCHIVKK